MKNQVLYSTVSKYYDQFNIHVDHRKEAAFMSWAINKYKEREGNVMLDVACGTGIYDALLKNKFKITGMDASREMLALAKKKVKGVSFKWGRMQSFNLHKKFDVILCRGAMDYNFNYVELFKTLKNFKRHIRPGGVVFFTFEYAKEGFKPEKLTLRSALDGSKQIVEISSSHLGKSKTTYEWRDFYVITNGTKATVLKDPHHKQGLFSVDRVRRMLEELGFKVVVYTHFTKRLWGKPYDRLPAYVGVKLK